MADRNKLLIVDDFEFNRLMLSDTFSDRDIIEAENGKRAIEEFELHKNELCAVLLDIMMPVMDGFGVLEYLVEKKYIEDVPVFIISADTSDKSLSRAYDLGAADVIAKPFNIRFVRRRINNIIELYDQRRHLRSVVSAQNKILEQQGAKK
ncbi:MAG: two-component system response regulator [Oscillospiraceae bacterium]